MFYSAFYEFAADERQPWTNYDNNGNEYLIIALDLSFVLNIQIFEIKHLIIGNVEKFVWSHKNDFQGEKSPFHYK